MSDGWLEVARAILKVPALLKEIYGDLLKPGVKQAGKALETIIGLGNTLLWPITLANDRSRLILKKNMEKFRLQISSVPEEKVNPLPPEIGVPIVEKLAYVGDEELSDLYINLLAKASTVDAAKFAHPGFIHVINNLCPDEAVFLKELYKNSDHAFITATVTDKRTGEYVIIGDLLTGIELDAGLSFPDNTSAYLSNFEGLGLIQISRDVRLANSGLYDRLEKIYSPKYIMPNINQEKNRIDFKRGKITITHYGNLFLEACFTNLEESEKRERPTIT